MRSWLESALLSVLGLMGVTITEEDPSSDPAGDARDRANPQDDFTHLELMKAREGGGTCVIFNMDSGPAAFRAPASASDQGEERCSNSLQSS